MSRLAFWSAGLIASLALVVASPFPWNSSEIRAQQAKKDAKQDPKKDAKKDRKKEQKANPAPKPAPPKPEPPRVKVNPLLKAPTDPIANAELGAVNPLDLARGLREHDMSDLALEYIRELDKQPNLPAEIKAQLPLERANCQLEAAVDEADEGSRISLIGEAKDGFLTFVRNKANVNHPRMPEAFLALARLASMDAKSQLAKARRVDVPEPDENNSNSADVDEATKKQHDEFVKARPLFLDAAKQLELAVKQIEGQLAKNPPAAVKRTLIQTYYDAMLARGTNFFSLSGTYPEGSRAKELEERDKVLNQAESIFEDLVALDSAPARVTGVARAWLSECEFAKKDLLKAEEQVKRIEASTGRDSEEAKRMIHFFKIRRDIATSLGGTNAERSQIVAKAREWLRHYGSLARARNEAFAVRWYLGYTLQVEAERQMPKPPPPSKNPSKGPPKPPPAPPAQARARFQEAEKLFRSVSQSDNEYTERAMRHRMQVVRRLLGEADKPPTSYKTFEECQMASLIRMSRLYDLQKNPKTTDAEILTQQKAIVALLERSRTLADPTDAPGDVADVNLRLIYFYEKMGQPYEAAILGDHLARTTKSPGGKSALAGDFALRGYAIAATKIKNVEAEKLDSVRKTDRDRAISLAKFIDTQFPNDTATDSAREKLAYLLYQDQKRLEAYEALMKVRPGYESISRVRLFEGAIANELLLSKESPLPANRRRDVFRKTTSDLDKLAKPLPGAAEEDVNPFIKARCRLALMYLLQPRVDPEAEKIDPGYVKARKVAEETLKLVPTFTNLLEDPATRSLNHDGWEMRLFAEDARTKAAVLEGTTFFAHGQLDEAYKAIGDLLAEMNRTGPFVTQVNAAFAEGGKPPAKKGPAPKKEPAKKEAAPPKKEAKEGAEADTADKAQHEKVVRLAEGVDKYRQNLIVLALKIRVKKGEAEQSVQQLDLLKKFGGSIENTIATLEQITAEMAAQIASLKKGGKAEEARTLADGFGKLLDKVSEEPNLPPSAQRFLGQSLILVGQYAKAVEALKKVPPPADRATIAKPNDIADEKERRTVLEFRRAQLELIRAYRAANQFAEADAVIADSMGTKEKPGWAANSVDFRKERAYLFEAKGAAAQGPAAKTAWNEALQEWGALANIYRALVSKGPPPGEGGGVKYGAYQNAYYEMYLNQHRCLIKANQQLLPKGHARFEKLYNDAGEHFSTLAMIQGGNFHGEVREQYRDYIMEVPELKAAYEKAAAAGLGKAKTMADSRERQAGDYRARAEKLAANSPDRVKLENLAKVLSDEATWIRKWTEQGGKFFLDQPSATN
ncbi:MAG TPA: hypothetical protein VN641_15485 [Urbifossiella sp.]|nr:hypothetical protein [Urbifossiella sp.]